MSFETVNWGPQNLEVRFVPGTFRKEEVETAVRHAERYFPTATANVPGDYFVSLGKNQAGVMAARIGNEMEGTAIRNATTKGTLIDLFSSLAQYVIKAFPKAA